ncbi:MAG: type I DNA topoisomerase [Candidatus Omnitrophica bacterium]|nr:type I DNA topoisomerase [Candidatus Omnitrophota bacterium]
MAEAEKKQTKKKATKKKRAPRGKYVVIVESPAKSKTINKILGKDYKVLASMGHIIDLPVSKMGIDFDNDFKPEYIIMRGRTKYLNALRKEAKTAKAIYLAADPDREGEAICWHLKNQLEKFDTDIYRVTFDEITAKAVSNAFHNPRQLDMNKINAQQARRVLDRIVGYSLSPLLWKKITRGLSAGRVQSVAVKMIMEREEEIRKFTPEEYWSVDALLRKKDIPTPEENLTDFKAKLVKYKGKKIEVSSKETSDKMVLELEKEKYIVKDISRKDKKSHPRSPFITSVIQQEAFNKLNFSVSKTMSVAQKLYEGIELGAEGSVGLITYMRTDSVRISNDAQKEGREYILDKYGEKYCPKEPPQYKSRKSAQEAHEAIRPTLPLRSPEEVSSHLTPDELKLYDLIWKRFLSSQMTSALYSVLTIEIDAGDYRFRAGGSRLLFDGYLRLYQTNSNAEGEMPEIPSLEEGEEVSLVELIPEQHFTKPPPRYTDASLVKTLEEKGIGRPSTYAPIIKTIVNRHYIKRDGRSLHPTELGELVNKLLVDHFPDILDDAFTARMEEELDEIEIGKINWVDVVREFYTVFIKDLEEAKHKMENVKTQPVMTDEVCELCGKPMVVKWGRRGKFLSCSDFPKCKFSKSITTGVACPEEGCDGELVERRSRRGAFYGCTKFPKCTYTNRKLPSDKEGQDEDEQLKEE